MTAVNKNPMPPKIYLINQGEMQAEDEGYAIYLDDSGSVSGSQNYWDTVVEILAQYGKDIKHYYFWNSVVIDADRKEFEKSIAGKIGRGGNQLRYVAQSVVNKKHHNVIMVTDGEVADYSVRETDEIFEKNAQTFKMKKAICYIVSSWNNKLNMSVTCAFTRSCESKVFTKENSGSPLKTIASYTPEDFKILDQLEEISLENLEAKYELIESLIIAQNMGKSGNIPLKNQIVNMKNRIVKELSKKMNKEKDYGEQMREALEKKDFHSAIEVARQMTVAYFADSDTTDIEKKISHLINLCGDLRGQYNLDQIKSNKMSTAKNAESAKPDLAVEVADLSQNPIECPIIMDEDVPQILIDECEPLLLGVEKGIVDDIAACPLRLLNYPDIKQKLKSRLSNFVGVKFTDKFHKNPFTQNRLLGAIPLGTHKSHVKAGNYTIAKLIAGGKILGNLNMYYAAIWMIIHEGEIEYLKDIEKNATEHLIYRMKNSKTMASLCGQAQFVTTQLPTDVAVWYCVNSGYLNQPTNRDTFRFHFFNINPLIKITEMLGYPNDEGLAAHCKRTKAMLVLLTKIKKCNTMEKKALKCLFAGLYQNGIFLNLDGITEKFKELEVCTPFVPIDGEATPESVQKILQLLPEAVRSLPVAELYYISTLVDASKSASDIVLPYNLVIPPLPKCQIHWCYGLEHFATHVKICPKTLRPYYHVDGQTWVEQAKKSFKVADVNKLFKGCKYIEQYIIKYKKKPTLTEIILFYYNRYVEAGTCKTLPFLTHVWSGQLLERYEVVFPEGYDIEKIISLLEKSRNIIVREEMESGIEKKLEEKAEKKEGKQSIEQKIETNSEIKVESSQSKSEPSMTEENKITEPIQKTS